MRLRTSVLKQGCKNIVLEGCTTKASPAHESLEPKLKREDKCAKATRSLPGKQVGTSWLGCVDLTRSRH